MRALGRGDFWCESINGLADFAELVRASAAYRLTSGATNARLNTFAAWVNDYCQQHGRADGIPEAGGRAWHLANSQFRRTLAWFIARRPGGVIAGALAYRHHCVQVFEGYAGTSVEAAIVSPTFAHADTVASFAALDANHDGKITFAEFSRASDPQVKVGDRSLTLQNADLSPQVRDVVLRDAFTRIDADHDGAISYDEFRRYTER